MFVGPDADHRTFFIEGLTEAGAVDLAVGQVHHVEQLLPRRRGQRDTDDLLQLLDGARRARTDRHDAAVGARVHRFLDRRLGLMQQLRHTAAGNVVLGMGIRIDALQTLQIRLHEAQAAAGGRVIAIHHQAFAERRLEGRVHADDLLPQVRGIESFFALHGPNFT